ncbi:hypothetical protein Plec18167_005550 [Paecilomyces lecythidis]|uniref:alpha-L-fucosidase n=1 Tax=Paecilomyces lecythidis TaxID=3004212 RepID=A0ABR3XJ33_9EURO
MLVASDVFGATVSGNVTYNYTDSSENTVSELRALPWWATLTINRGEIIFPYRYTANRTDFNTSHIFEYTAALLPGKKLDSITLPSTTNATTGRLHVFAISLWRGSSIPSSNLPSASAEIQFVRPTQKWVGDGYQVVEVTVNNPGTKRVDVAVSGSSNGTLTVMLEYDGLVSRHTIPHIELGLTEWTSDYDSISRHESPQWFDDDKYGIFIHWGPYSVPGWGNSTPYETYAEWWYSTHRAADVSDVYDYRLRTFGPTWNYDDSFPDFTAANFDPKGLVDLIHDSGAKYFVLTTKHHDGFALFDTAETTHRNALHYGPKRDLVREIFDSAAEYHPYLHRGTYFSLPEWFNPDFGPYGFASGTGNASNSWPGIIARNPYTDLNEPYTGRLPINDFIADLMVPQMEILAYNYSTDIMWCDCGAANGTAGFAANWWNSARAENRQVTINSRCGIPQASDFDTPEYTTFSSAQRHKWETNEGMDPFSYGYNRATPPGSYMNASSLIHDLVDIVSKNGNFLLDIGPRADGSIVEAEIQNLREAGKWIHAHGEAIFNTTYWFVMSEYQDYENNIDVRFTQTNDAFYILILERPSSDEVYIDAPIPVLDGDSVTVLNLVGGESQVQWKRDSQKGTGVTFHIPGDVFESDNYCWVLKVEYSYRF